MISDLRFIIGAVTAVALLGFTLFGLVAAVHITHQSRVGPLEASRLLAYAPEFRQPDIMPSVVAPAVEEPFSPTPLPDPVDVSEPPSDPAEPAVQQAALTGAPQDPPAAMPAISTAPAPTEAPAEPADVREVADVRDPVDVRETAHVRDTANVQNAGDEQSVPDVQSIPVVQSAPAVQDAPDIKEPADVTHVASIPRKEDAAETASEVAPDAEEREVTRPKKRVRRVKRQVRQFQPIRPFASTGYPLFAATAATTTAVVDRPAKGFWVTD